MSALDRFKDNGSGLSSPITRWVDATPHDTNEEAFVSRAVYVGSGGSLSVLTLNGDSVSFENVANGQLLPIRVRRINDTGTAAGDILLGD
ncbi:MAG: spike base protein, RCAP_Rcc01079 family [Phycisphaerales bacterium]